VTRGATDDGAMDEALRRARDFAAKGQDDAAKLSYVEVLRYDPTHLAALNELGTLAHAGGFRSAARTAYGQAVQHHPGNGVARVNLGNLLYEEGDAAAAMLHYQAALAVDHDLAEAHQGMARALTLQGDDAAAAPHWQKGFADHAMVAKPYRGTGTGVSLVMLVSARGGNIPTQQWIDDRHFAVTAIYAEFYDPSSRLPPHELVVNAIGDADLCQDALRQAEEMVAGSVVPVINRPGRVRSTGRAENARRLASIPGVIAPRIQALPKASILAAEDLEFPLLLRRPGFHTGQHFLYVESRAGLPRAIAALPGEELLAIQYLDARGADGMARKYRVMFIDDVAYPLHLAISADWKVHYFTAGMANSAAHREEERRFLEDMPAVLGIRALTALGEICRALGLEYSGIDFALAPDGSVILFEANATMVAVPPGSDPMWDYRRAAVAAAIRAARRMLLRRADASRFGTQAT